MMIERPAHCTKNETASTKLVRMSDRSLAGTAAKVAGAAPAGLRRPGAVAWVRAALRVVGCQCDVVLDNKKGMTNEGDKPTKDA